MVRTRWIAGLLVASSLVACGKKPEPKEPDDEEEPAKPEPQVKPETEADREAKRLAAAQAIVPDGSACLPPALKEAGAPRIELGEVGGTAGICAIDQDASRLLGPVACWKVNVGTNELTYVAPAPLPGIGFQVKTDAKCARGYCLPESAPAAATAHIVWSPDGGKVAVAAGDQIHLFDTSNKSHLIEFPIRGDKGVTGEVTGLYWVGDSVFVSGSETGGVWVFKADGAPVGGIEVLGGKPGQLLSLKHGGSFSILNKNQVAIAEQGWTTFTTYDVDSGKRTKSQRKLAKSPCKADETTAYWNDPSGAPDGKCKDYMTKTFGYWAGANGILGSKNLVIVLRNERLGELGVVDPKTLIEQKKVIKMAWCGAGGGGDVAPPGE